MRSPQVSIRAGKLLMEDQIMDLGGIVVRREVARGANGIILMGWDEYLERPVAVKVWLKLRYNDKRDKIKQGIAEARKAHAAAGRSVIDIFTANVSLGYFFTVMEYFDAAPLREWLISSSPPNFLWRYAVAEQILSCVVRLQDKGLFHGDLHSGNILVRPLRNDDVPGSDDLRIIDFGTSLFSGPSFSMRRHNKLLLELVDMLLLPFNFTAIMSKRTEHWVATADPGFAIIVQDYVEVIREGLGELGYLYRRTSQDGPTFEHCYFDPRVFRSQLPDFERTYNLRVNPVYLQNRGD